MAAINAVTLQGVYENGATPKTFSLTQQTLKLARGETERVKMAVVDPSGTAVNLTGGSVVLTIEDAAGIEKLARQADLDTPASGLCSFPFAANDTSSWTAGTYYYDVWLISGAGGPGANGDRNQLVARSKFVLEAAVTEPGTLVTPLPSQAPLAQGPAGAQGPQGPQGPAGTFAPSTAYCIRLNNPDNGEQGGQHIDCGPFWLDGVDLGPWFWEIWFSPQNGGYWVIDGTGGFHRIAMGTTDVAGLKLTCNVLYSLASVLNTLSLGSDEALESGVWHHMALMWLGGTEPVRLFLNGILVDRVAWPTGAESRSAPYSPYLGQTLFIGGSHHAMAHGRVGWVRGFEGATKVPPFMGDAAFRVPSTPPGYYWEPNLSLTRYAPQFLMAFDKPGGRVFPDMSAGYNSVTHPGRAHRSTTNTAFGEPSGLDLPNVEAVTDAPWTPNVIPPNNSVTPGTPAGDDLFYHSFAERDRVFAWGESGGVGALEYGTNGGTGATWESHMAGSGLDNTTTFGVLKHQLVVLHNTTSQRAVGWWRVPGLTDAHIIGTRKVGSFGLTQQWTGVAASIVDRGNFYFAVHHNWSFGTGVHIGYYVGGALNWVAAQLFTPSPSNFTTLGLSVNRTTGRIKATTDGNVIADLAIPGGGPAPGDGWGAFVGNDGLGKTTSLWRSKLIRGKAPI
jgi:hypothetical protein